MLLSLAGSASGTNALIEKVRSQDLSNVCSCIIPYSLGLFLVQIFCLVLSPVFFAGVNYVLFLRVERN